jgi:hypothetical protein
MELAEPEQHHVLPVGPAGRTKMMRLRHAANGIILEPL